MKKYTEKDLVDMLKDAGNETRRNEALAYLYEKEVKPKVEKWISKDFWDIRELALDVFQESVTDFVKSMANYQEKASLSTYWLRIYRYNLYRELEKAKKVTDCENWEIFRDTSLTKEEEMIENDEQLAMKKKLSCVKWAKEKIGENCKELLETKYEKGLSWKEIAEKLGILEDAARRRGADCIRKMRDLMKKCLG